MELLFDFQIPLAISSRRVCMKSENIPTGAIIMVPNHKPLITLAAFFFPRPPNQIFQPVKKRK